MNEIKRLHPDLTSYFNSIDSLLSEHQRLSIQMKRSERLSVIYPIVLIPIVALVFMFWHFVSRYFPQTFIKLPPNTPGVAGIIAFVAALIISTFLSTHRAFGRRKIEMQLGLAGISFGYLYLVLRNLENYQLTRVSERLKAAAQYWDSFLKMFHRLVAGTSYESPEQPFIPETVNFAIAAEWPEVQNEVTQLVAGINNLPTQLTYRIKKGEDLDQVKMVIQELLSFTFSYVSSTIPYGRRKYQSLLGVALIVNKLPTPSVQKTKSYSLFERLEQFVSRKSKIAAVLFLWVFFLAFLVCGVGLVKLIFPSIQIGELLAGSVLMTSLIAAVTLAPSLRSENSK